MHACPRVATWAIGVASTRESGNHCVDWGVCVVVLRHDVGDSPAVADLARWMISRLSF